MSNKNELPKLNDATRHLGLTTDIFASTNDLGQSAAFALLSELSKSNAKKGKHYETMLQTEACLASALTHNHGDIAPLKELLENMAGGVRKNAMKEFLTTFAPIKWIEQEKGEAVMKFDRTKRICSDTAHGDKTFQESNTCATMLVTPWTLFKPEPKYRPLDPAVVTLRVAKQMIERFIDAKEGDKVTQVQCDAMLELLPTMGVKAGDVSELRLMLTAGIQAKADQAILDAAHAAEPETTDPVEAVEPVELTADDLAATPEEAAAMDTELNLDVE